MVAPRCCFFFLCACSGESRAPDPSGQGSGSGDTVLAEGCAADSALSPRLIEAVLPSLWPEALTAAELNGLIQPNTQISTGDLDRDGLPDLILTQFLGNAVVLHNDGACGFSLWHDLGPVATARAADIDADGDVDVLTVRIQDPEAYAADIVTLFQDSGTDAGGPPPQDLTIEVMLNDGDGSSFTPSDLGFSGPVSQCAVAELGGELISDLVWGLEVHDLDLDGDLDITVRNFFACPATHLAVEGGRITGELPGMPSCRADSGFAVGDVDADGRGDLVCTSYAGFGLGVGVQVFLGDGRGYTPLKQGALHVGDSPMGTALLDIDGDGQLDLFSSDNGWPRVSLFLDGFFYEAGQALGVDPSRTFEPVDDEDHTTSWTPVPLDYDGDGDIDIVLSASLEWPDQPHPQHVFVYENQAGEAMPPTQEALGLVDEAHEMSALRIDIDQDGDEDVLLGSALLGGHAARLLVNGTDARFVMVESRLASGQPAFGTRVVATYGEDIQIAHNFEGSTGHGGHADARTHVARTWSADGQQRPLTQLTLYWPDGEQTTLDPSPARIIATHPGR